MLLKCQAGKDFPTTSQHLANPVCGLKLPQAVVGEGHISTALGMEGATWAIR